MLGNTDGFKFWRLRLSYHLKEDVHVYADLCDKYITGFRKYYGMQPSLLVILENWKKSLDKEENVYTIFMDRSKALDTTKPILIFRKSSMDSPNK